jgi:DNA-directed RNA polymerase subunit omega
MARVTVEDCILNIPNRFELIAIASQRAKQISSGMPLTVDRDNDKDAVVALREIADKTVEISALREELVQSQQKRQVLEKLEHAEQVERMKAENGDGEINEAFADAGRIGMVASVSQEEEEAEMSFSDEDMDVED